MDYEKKYKNALTIAQSRFKIEKDESVLTCLGMMFPELRESEDERIIRAIIDALYSHTNSINLLSSRGYQMGNIEAWLEKHKYDRMKPVYDNQDSFESALGKAWKDYNDSGAITVDGCEDNYVECAHAKGFREGYLFGLEKQKEYHIPWYDYQKSKEAGYTIVPNEEYEQLIKQKEQKPTWSEEDEFRLKEALEVLDESIRHLPIGYGYVTDVMNVTKWLKSLRPSWKPSEEQMDALKELIDDANRAGWVTPGATELYEQLKKL